MYAHVHNTLEQCTVLPNCIGSTTTTTFKIHHTVGDLELHLSVVSAKDILEHKRKGWQKQFNLQKTPS